MTNEDLKRVAARGFIPYVGESEEAFLARCAWCEAIKEKLSENEYPIQSVEEMAPTSLEFQNALTRAKELYGVAPSWVPVIISDEKIPFWQGGVALIFQLSQASPLSALIQLRHKVYSFWADREELLVHEMLHIARMGFNEKRFEEILAYSSSKYAFYRYLGPLFRTSFESIFFTSMLIIILTLDMALLMSGSSAAYDSFLPLKLLPLFYLLYLAVRLWLDQKVFQKTVEKLGLPAVLCLTDQEIQAYSESSLEAIKSSLDNSLRHKVIKQRLNFSLS